MKNSNEESIPSHIAAHSKPIFDTGEEVDQQIDINSNEKQLAAMPPAVRAKIEAEWRRIENLQVVPNPPAPPRTTPIDDED